MSSRTKNIGWFGGHDCNSLFPSGQNVITLNITHSYQYSVQASGNYFSPERHTILYGQTHKSEAASKYLMIIGKTRKLSHPANSDSVISARVCISRSCVTLNHWKMSTHVGGCSGDFQIEAVENSVYHFTHFANHWTVWSVTHYAHYEHNVSTVCKGMWPQCWCTPNKLPCSPSLTVH